MKRAESLARSVSAASTDDIRKGRAAEVFNDDQLAAEPRESRAATAAAKGDLTRMGEEKRAFFEQQMTNETEKARHKKNEMIAASSSQPPPPPTPGACKVKKR